MIYPLVRDLAAAGAPIRVPVAVTCRVLKIARAPYYRWLAQPVTDAEWVQAHRANVLFEAHRDDLEFGHQLLRIAIVTRIERTYHRRRRQAALGRLTPIEFETIMTTPASQAA